MYEPKYEVGDYLAHQESVYLEVLDVVAGSSSGETVYELRYHNIMLKDKGESATWETEHELDVQGLEKREPDFEKWKSVKPGEFVRMSPLPSATIIKVINRRGDDVMLSETPLPKKLRRDVVAAMDKLSSQIEELTDGDLTTEDMDRMKPMIVNSIGKSSTNSYKSAHGRWHTVHELALMNWILMRE